MLHHLQNTIKLASVSISALFLTSTMTVPVQAGGTIRVGLVVLNQCRVTSGGTVDQETSLKVDCDYPVPYQVVKDDKDFLPDDTDTQPRITVIY